MKYVHFTLHRWWKGVFRNIHDLLSLRALKCLEDDIQNGGRDLAAFDLANSLHYQCPLLAPHWLGGFYALNYGHYIVSVSHNCLFSYNLAETRDFRWFSTIANRINTPRQWQLKASSKIYCNIIPYVFVVLRRNKLIQAEWHLYASVN